MSRSSPGRYALQGFAKNVYDLSAEDGTGRRLTLARVAPNRWRVDGHDGTVVVRYRVFGGRRSDVVFQRNPELEVVTFESAGRSLTAEQEAFRDSWLASATARQPAAP